MHQSIVILLVAVAILGGLAAIYTVKWVVIASMLGLGIGTILVPPTDAAQKRFKVPRAVTSLFLLLVMLGVIVGMGYFLVSVVSDEIVPQLKNLPSLTHKVENKYHQFTSHWSKAAATATDGESKKLSSDSDKKSDDASAQKSDAAPAPAPTGDSSKDKAAPGFDIQKYIGGAAAGLASGLMMGFSVIGGLIFIFFLALYYAISPETYVDGFVSMFPAHMRAKVRSIVKDSSVALNRWFMAQLLAMGVVAVFAGVALKIVGSPYWFFFAAITFVLELIPYFGPWTAFATVAGVTAASDSSSLTKTCIAFGIVLLLEGNVVMPLVMKGRVEIPPIHLLVLMTVMGEWFGLFGFLMAAPTLMVARTIYQKAYLPAMNRQKVPPSEIPATPTQAA